MPPVQIAVTQHVRRGCEAEFESQLREFARDSLQFPGTTGVLLVGPVPGTKTNEYGILRSFESEAACEAFYQSEMFKHWQAQSVGLINGAPYRRRLTGLEAFFRELGTSPPPRWKMALLTWLGVFPTVLLWSNIVPPLLIGLHSILVAAIVNACAVITLAWGVMPLLVRLFNGWLRRPT